MRALIGQAVEKFGRIDCLFNNAGGPAQTGGIEGLEVERFDAAMATLVRSVMLGMKHAAPHMRQQGSGSIINNGSIAGTARRIFVLGGLWRGQGGRHPSHQMRGDGARRVRRSRQLDLAGRDRHRHLRQGAGPVDRSGREDADVMREVYKTAQPIPRAGLPEDIAHAAVFLASDESSSSMATIW